MPLHFDHTTHIKPADLSSMFNKPFCFIVLFLIPFILNAQEDTIDSFIKKNLESLHIPGASFIVTKNGKIIKSGSYGLSNIELGVPASPKTVYEIGSMTKQFTAMGIMMLAEEGKLDLNNPITHYFPAAPSAWKNITIRHLLTHTSGIQNHVAVPGYLGVFKTNLFNEGFPGKKVLLKLFFRLPQEFTPGQTWAYDNTGYHLLGLIIEQISKQSYWTFLETKIFNPLGMMNTKNTDTKELVYNRASGYIWQDSAYKNQPALWPFVGFSAGSLLSTVEDLAIWDAALYTEKLVDRKSTRLNSSHQSVSRMPSSA